MIGKKLLNQKPLPLAEVESIIQKRKKDGELSYEQNLTLEYCKKFSKLNSKEAKQLLNELVKLEKVNEKYAIVLADIMPVNADEVQMIFAKEHYVLSDEEKQSILEILNKFRKEKKPKTAKKAKKAKTKKEK